MSKWTLAAACGLAVASVASAGGATYTHVRTGSESNHHTLFNALYGGSFIGSPSLNVGVDQGNGSANNAVTLGFSNGAWDFVRVMDAGGVSPLDLQGVNSGFAQDTNWQDGVVDVRVTAKIAGDNHVFGWHDDTGSGEFQAITNTVVGNEETVSLSTSFRWGLETNQGLDVTSDPMSNLRGSDAVDMMVTYAMYHNGSFYGWLLTWEDRLNGDFDYNDAWLEIAVVTIPSPFAGGMAGVGLMGLAARRRRG